MSDGTKIEWTDATWNIVNGCSVLSPGCTNCYAMRLAGTRLKHHPSREGLTIDTKAGPVWTGEVRFNEKVLLDPIKWKRPRKIFVCAHGDLFHESVPDEWIDQIFSVMALAHWHVFQLLTKRPERMKKYLTDKSRARCDGRGEALIRLWNASGTPSGERIMEGSWPLPNVWLGVSAEDQVRANERIPSLLDTPAAVRWLSCEPLLGELDIFPWLCVDEFERRVDWVVAGGESGPGARPMQAQWARLLRDQCASTGVPFLFKQWGAYFPTSDANGPYMMRMGKKAAGRLLDGVEHNGYPA